MAQLIAMIQIVLLLAAMVTGVMVAFNKMIS